MDLSERIEAFARLGEYLKENLQEATDMLPSPGITGGKLFADPDLNRICREAGAANPWFIPFFIHYALSETARMLDRDKLEQWTARYPGEKFRPGKPRVIGTILAGNIPLVGFHDFLSILLSGHRFKGKLSGKDERILPFLADMLLAFESRFAPSIQFEESRIGSIDAMIATGSNNTFRYFEYYFGKYPHIFRKNRNGIALLRGDESSEELEALANDIFLYFGMGCRSVAKLYVPEVYDFDRLFKEMEKYRDLIDHNKYANNYQYQRSVYLVNRVEHLDNGFLLLRHDPAISSPVGTLHYQTWSPETGVPDLRRQQDAIQCIAGRELTGLPGMEGLTTVNFGQTQQPEPWDYADNMDTLNFLINLYQN